MKTVQREKIQYEKPIIREKCGKEWILKNCTRIVRFSVKKDNRTSIDGWLYSGSFSWSSSDIKAGI